MNSTQIFRNDHIFQIAVEVTTDVFSITLMTKLLSSNVNLFINKLLMLTLISDIIRSISKIVLNLRIVNIDINYGDVATGIIGSIFTAIRTVSFLIVVDMRNKILIRSKPMYIFTKVVILIVIGVFIPPFLLTDTLSYAYNSTSIFNFINEIIVVFASIIVNIIDTISNIYLLIYYQKYYFTSVSVMKYLYSQMRYRRNWIYFVIFLEIMGFFLIATAIKGIYPTTSASFLGALIFIFDVNTMIDFVKFDTVRNEIVIGDQTINLYDTIRVQSGRIRSLRV